MVSNLISRIVEFFLSSTGKNGAGFCLLLLDGEESMENELLTLFRDEITMTMADEVNVFTPVDQYDRDGFLKWLSSYPRALKDEKNHPIGNICILDLRFVDKMDLAKHLFAMNNQCQDVLPQKQDNTYLLVLVGQVAKKMTYGELIELCEPFGCLAF